jgi:hypothetical protein
MKSVKKYQFTKFTKVKQITIKRMRTKSDRKKNKGRWNRKISAILKIISNKTNNNWKNKDQIWYMKNKIKGLWNWNKSNFINYFI